MTPADSRRCRPDRGQLQTRRYFAPRASASIQFVLTPARDLADYARPQFNA